MISVISWEACVGDLLIRNLDDALKRELQGRARESGRSLSDEAIAHLRRSLAISEDDDRPAGEWIASLLSTERWTIEELAAMEAARSEPDREPPKFDE